MGKRWRGGALDLVRLRGGAVLYGRHGASLHHQGLPSSAAKPTAIKMPSSTAFPDPPHAALQW